MENEEAINLLTERIIGAAIEVHRAIGPGLLESVYQTCLAAEFRHRGIPFEAEVPFPIIYRDVALDHGLRLDFLVAGLVVLETKAVDRVIPVFEAQLLSNMKLARKRVGLLINFNVPLLKDGITRRVL